MLKVGMVGVGGISGSHIPAWEAMEDAQLVALCDIRPERTEPYSDKRRYVDFEEMLANEELDILDICLPTYLHADYAARALERGIHVLCEKPISLKKEDVNRLYSLAREHNVRFMVAQVLRFWSEYEYVKKLYDEKTYGALISGSMSRLSGYPNWSWDGWMTDEERCGLVPFDLHIHDLDFMIYAFGQPKNVSNFRERREGQDWIHAVYDFGDFTISAEAAWYASPYPFRAQFLFQFENAVVAWDKNGLKTYERGGNILDFHPAEANETGNIGLPTTNAYANEIRYFADCVRNGVDAEKVKAEELSTVLDLAYRFKNL